MFYGGSDNKSLIVQSFAATEIMFCVCVSACVCMQNIQSVILHGGQLTRGVPSNVIFSVRNDEVI